MYSLMWLLWIFIIGTFSKTLNDFVAPYSKRISAQVAGKMTLWSAQNNHEISNLSLISEIKSEFQVKAASILKDNILSFLRIDHSTFDDKIKIAKYTRMQLVQALMSITSSHSFRANEYARKRLHKRTSKDTIDLIENVIVNIAKWKHDHPEEFHGLVEMEKKLVDLIKPGEDGTWHSSKLVTDYKYLSSIGIQKVITLAVTFAAGAITMAYVLGVFDSVKDWWIGEDDEQDF